MLVCYFATEAKVLSKKYEVLATDKTLKEYLKGRTQRLVSQELGITPGALSQILKTDRRIFVRKVGRSLQYLEIKPWQRMGHRRPKRP